MAKIFSNSQVDHVLRNFLSPNYKLSPLHDHNGGATGCDLIAETLTLDQPSLYIEIEGRDEYGSVNERNFQRAFFRIVSRIKDLRSDEPYRLIMALPIGYGRGARQRRQNLGPAWEMIGNTFKNLEIWLVPEAGSEIQMIKWNDFGMN